MYLKVIIKELVQIYSQNYTLQHANIQINAFFICSYREYISGKLAYIYLR